MLPKALLAQLQSSIILRISIATLISLLIINASLDMRHAAEAQIKRQQQLQGAINRNRQYAGEQQWPERARQAGVTLVNAETRLWRTASPGLAQAEFHDWLQTTLKQASATMLQVDMSNTQAKSSPDNQGLYSITAKVSFEFSPTGFREWLVAVTGADKQIIIDQLLIRQEPRPRIEAQLIAPYRIQAQPDPNTPDRLTPAQP